MHFLNLILFKFLNFLNSSSVVSSNFLFFNGDAYSLYQNLELFNIFMIMITYK